MTLPKDIEEALSAFSVAQYNAGQMDTHGAPPFALMEAICRHIGTAPTQRQRYKEAAITGLLADPSRSGNPKDYAVFAADHADLLAAEDAEHAKKESTK